MQPDHDRVAVAIETVISRYGLGMLCAIAGDFHDQTALPPAARHRHACFAFDTRRIKRGLGHGAGPQGPPASSGRSAGYRGIPSADTDRRIRSEVSEAVVKHSALLRMT